MKNLKRIHLLGVGGIAMGNLAILLQKSGYQVSGSDQKLYPPMSTQLAKWDITVKDFSAKNLKNIDLCIVGNVISRGNIELEALLNHTEIEYISMPQALWQFFLKGKKVIAVTGTHGKTSTSFLIDHILQKAKIRNGFFAGGIRADGEEGFRLAKSPYFVIEGDEYDSAFFDKASKFLHYKPHYLVINALEYDHLDIFPNFQAYQKSFQNLLHILPNQGFVVASYNSLNVKKLLHNYKWSPIFSFQSNFKSKKKLRESLENFAMGKKKYNLSFLLDLENFSLFGEHNRANALSASILALGIGVSLSTIKKALESYPGVMRRQQKRFKKEKIIFIEDFAHHPTAVKACLDAMKEIYPKRKIHVFFEPRSASSHHNFFQEDYQKCFSKADFLYINEIYNQNKFTKKDRLDVPAIVRYINQNSKYKTKAYYAPTPLHLLENFKKKFQPFSKGDVILGLSNGNFGGIYPSVEKFLSKIFHAS